MAYGIIPIAYYGNVNSLTPVKDWEIPAGSPITLYFILSITDALGTRRYIPPAGTSVQVSFMRSRPATVNSTTQTITKTALPTAPTEDKSIYQCLLTAEEASTVLSGTVQLIVTQAGSTYKTNIQYLVRKTIAAPGF